MASDMDEGPKANEDSLSTLEELLGLSPSVTGDRWSVG